MTTLLAKPDRSSATNKLKPLWPACLLGSQGKAQTFSPASLSALHWDELVNTAQAQQLAPLLYWCLHSSPVAVQPPATVMERLRSLYLAETCRALLRSHELHTVLTALVQAGIQPTLYKGAALAHKVYPTPTCRPMGDLDLWVTAAEMPRAQAVIETLGYTQKLKPERPLPLQEQQDGEIQLQGSQRGQGMIELHWGVFAGQWLQHVAKINREAVFERRTPTEILGIPVHVLSDEDAVIQLAVHLGINHQLSLHPLRSLVDIALLDQQGVDWDVVTERVYSWRLATIVGSILELLVNIFGPEHLTPGLVEAASILGRSRVRRVMTGQWVRPTVVLEQYQLRATRRRFLYLLSMVDRPTDMLCFLSSVLWPDRGWLALRYGQVNWPIRLSHLTAVLSGDF